MKIPLKLVLLFTLAAVAANTVFADELATILNGLQAKENNISLNIKDITSVQAVELGAAPGQTVITSYVKGKKTRQDTTISMNGQETAQILLFDGKDSWMINSTMKMKMSSSRVSVDAYDQFMKTSSFVNLKSKVLKIDKMYGRDAYVVETVYADQESFAGTLRVWLDKENFNTYLMIYLDTAGKENMKLIFMDYRNVYDKIQMPYRIEMHQSGQLMSRIVVRSIKVNQQLKDTLFDASQFKVPEQPDMSALMATIQARQAANGGAAGGAAGGIKGSDSAAEYLKLLKQQQGSKNDGQ